MSDYRSNLIFCCLMASIYLVTMMASDETAEAATMEKRHRPQHWLLQLVTVVPLCCLAMTSPVKAFTTRSFAARQHVSVRPSPYQGRHMLRPQPPYSPRNQISDLSMTVRKMVRV